MLFVTELINLLGDPYEWNLKYSDRTRVVYYKDIYKIRAKSVLVGEQLQDHKKVYRWVIDIDSGVRLILQ